MSKKTVSFNSYIEVHYYHQEVPCLQEYLYGWDECKKTNLMHYYQEKHGSLVGFNLDEQRRISQTEDEALDTLLKLAETGSFFPLNKASPPP